MSLLNVLILLVYCTLLDALLVSEPFWSVTCGHNVTTVNLLYTLVVMTASSGVAADYKT